LNPEVALHFRDELREARAIALKDAEAFEQIVFVLERLGVLLAGQVMDLGRYRAFITKEALRSPLAGEVPTYLPEWHAPFETLYALVQQGRNDALHQGAFARNLTNHAVELTLVLEDALMADAEAARDFMVRDPVCAFLWQPISSVRRSMLANSFSFLPVAATSEPCPKWMLISDFELASYLRRAKSSIDKKQRLATPLREAAQGGQVSLIDAPTCKPEDRVDTVLTSSQGKPVLVIGPDGDLRGIVTPFDLL
jgi:hypothetical protein